MGVKYNPGVVSNGLVGYWDAGNRRSYPGTGTTWTDLSGNGNNGTLTNGPTFNSGNGGVIVFDGVDDQVTINSNSAFNWGAGDWTIDIHFFLSSTYATNGLYTTVFSSNQMLIGTLRSSLVGIASFYSVGVNPMFIGKTFGSYTTGSFEYDCAGKWTNLTLTKNGATTSCYLNGIFYASKTSDTYTNQNNSGTISTNSDPFGGNFSMFKIYNRALSAQEVSQNFNALRGRYGI